MNDLERFKAVAHFEQPDYVPIFAFAGAPGMSWGAMQFTHDRLVETGMPSWVGGRYVNWECLDVESWYRYWGTTGPIGLDFGLAWGAQGIGSTTRVVDGYEIIEGEDGSITRQVIDNDKIYIMPEYIRYSIRDRASWEFFKERITPHQFMSREEMEANCRRFDDRTMPLCIGAGSGYGLIRSLMGPEAASIAFYDDPELVHDIVSFYHQQVCEYVFPLIERIKPEIVGMSEDCCYNHGMLISPAQFEEFFGNHYREVCDCARANGVDMVSVDTDGNAMEFTDLARSFGVKAIYPYEVKAGNDLFALREQYPDFILFGWLEKETVNEGNEADITPEIMNKVPALLKKGGYFPNGDHGIQPDVTFPNMCKFMTLLHEVCGNPEGEFPRVG